MFKNYKKTAALLLILMTSAPLWAQEITIGDKIPFFSEILHENRELWISLPESYNDSTVVPADYPVMYLLDPEFHFHSMVAVREALTRGMYKYMPEMIIVGIGNTDRSRDLTPTNSFVVHSGKKIHKTSGGADRFLAFITDELIPFIDSEYRSSGYRLINGHSFGGLFALYVLQYKPETFHSYIVHDPSIWWDDQYLYNSALQQWGNLKLEGRNLYLSMAYYNEQETDRLQHAQTIELYRENILENGPANGLRYQFEYFENDDHGTIFLSASYRAMQFIFDGICLPVKKIPEEPELLAEHYNALSKKLCFPMHAPEKLVAQIANYCMLREQPQSALRLLQQNSENYPNSAYAHYQLAELYFKLENYELAEKEYEKAAGLNPALPKPKIVIDNN